MTCPDTESPFAQHWEAINANLIRRERLARITGACLAVLAALALAAAILLSLMLASYAYGASPAVTPRTISPAIITCDGNRHCRPGSFAPRHSPRPLARPILGDNHD